VWRVVRVLVALWAVGNLVAGVALLISGQPGGVFAMAMGGVALFAVVFERARYRFDRADRSVGMLRSAPGGSAAPEPPFQPTDEVFVDPTTRQRVRVYLDPGTGERRYHVEAEAGSG